MSMQDERLKRELNFLVLKFLNQPGLESAYQSFLQCILRNRHENALELPSTSSAHSLRRSEDHIEKLVEELSHITPTYLLDTLRAVKQSVNNGPAPGLITTLGHSSYSLPALVARTGGGEKRVCRRPDSNNFVVNLSRRQYGENCLKSAMVRKTANSPSLVTRILGHLAPIYCIVIDKTGTVAFTGADDGLVKGWSLDRYFLLVTLRGHKKEISDLSINAENTMLASGSCDKEVRIWCLQTSRNLTVLTGHRATINSLHFSPNSDYLTTSSSDGLVCFWPVTGLKSVSDDPIPFHERVRASDKLVSSSYSAGGTVLAVGSSDGDIFTYTVRGKLGLPVKDQTLEGHTAMVITLTFAKRSLRLVSGSRDGSVRIWTRSEGTWDHVICTARTPVVPDRDPKEQIDVLLAQWSSNESKVLASCSDTSIRMWDLAGNLVQVFLGHDDLVYFVQEHPLVSNVLVSCGHDSRIITWSMEDGVATSTFLNVIEGEGRASVLEASFTPDGESLLTVDANGHVTVFGHKLLHDFVTVPREQFFSTDYISLIRDRFSNVLDEQSELPPHLVGPPYMVDQQGMALPPGIQGLIPGRHFLSPDEIAQRARRKKKKKEFDFVERSAVPRERILSSERINDTNTDIPELADFQRSFVVPENVHEDANYEHIPAVIPPMTNYDLFDGIMAQSIAMISSERSRELWLHRQIVPNISDLQINKSCQDRIREEELRKLGEVEVKVIGERNRRAQKLSSTATVAPTRLTRQSHVMLHPLQESSSGSESSLVEQDPEEDEEQEDSSDADWQVNRKQKRKIVLNEPEQDEQSDDSQRRTSSKKKRVHSSDEDKSDEDVPSSSTRRSQKRRRVREPVATADAVLSPDMLRSVRRPKRNTSSKEEAIKNVKQMLRSKSPPESPETPNAAAGTAISDKEDSDMLELIEQYKPPRWLTQIEPVRSPYLPQISDKIYYFVQGHMDYVNSDQCPAESRNFRPWEKVEFPHAQLCQVLSLSFSTGPPTLCQIKLVMLDTNGSVDEIFSFRYHDAPNIPDFMVLKRHYEDSMNHKWMKGDRFRSLIDDAWWEGSVLSMSAVDDEYPKSPWKRIVVKWDNEPDSERLSAWDIEPLPKDKRSAKGRSSCKRHSSHQEDDGSGPSRQQHFNFGAQNPSVGGPLDPYILSYYHSNGKWRDGETREEFKERLGEALVQIMDVPDAQEFLYPVNFTDHPDYYTIVGYPVSLSTIHGRLLADHYRSIDSFLWEIRQLEINARVYNEDASEIVQDVTNLVTRLVLFVKNPVFKNITTDITPDMVSEELENRSKSKKRKRRLRVRSADKTEWFERASSVLDQLVNHPDSHPFRTPVDLSIYNDYLKYCQEPMDLETITDKLQGGSYEHELEFFTDIDLIFSNSFNYNTSKTSMIYRMTKRLKEYYGTLIDHLASDELPGSSIEPTRPKMSVPLELVVPKRRIAVSSSSSNASSGERPTTRSQESSGRSSRSSASNNRASSKGKEPVSKRSRIYTTSEEDEKPGYSPNPSAGGGRRQSQGETDHDSRGNASYNSVSSSPETADSQQLTDGGRAKRECTQRPVVVGKRSKRTKNRVNYQDIDHDIFESDQNSDSDQSSESSRRARTRLKGKGDRGKTHVNGNGRKKTVARNSKPKLHVNGKGKQKLDTTDSDSGDQSIGDESGQIKQGNSDSDERSPCGSSDELSEAEGRGGKSNRSGSEGQDSDDSDTDSSVSSGPTPRKRSTRTRSQRSETNVKTKNGRSVKKNMRYDDFF